jgi:glucose/arabinose dehydrogenase
MRRLGFLGIAATALVACGSGAGSAEPRASAQSPDATASASAAPDAQPAAKRGVRLARIGSFDQPLYVTAPPGDRRRVFVVEQDGRIRVVRAGKTLSAPFLDISGQVTAGGEQGLLSMAFAPDYVSSGLFYVYYTDSGGDQRVVEYKRATPDRADAGSARELMRMADDEGNHNGGLLLFGPDRLLYIGTGDGGGGGDQHGERGNGQNLGSLLGKILRIDPKAAGGRPYGIPSDNPFVGRSGARGEIYSYGLRNPWRYSFDRSTGDLSIGDVGQDKVEEIDFVRKGRGRGANFGWRVFEGRSRYSDGESAPGAVAPVIQRTHDQGWCSITGGVVVRDPKLPGLRGRYVFGDYCKGDILSAQLRAGSARGTRSTGLHVESLSSFGEDALGRVYATSSSGPVYRLVAR